MRLVYGESGIPNPSQIAGTLAWIPLNLPRYLELSPSNGVISATEVISGGKLISPYGGEPVYSPTTDNGLGGTAFTIGRCLQSETNGLGNILVSPDPIWVIIRTSPGSSGSLRGTFISTGNGVTGYTTEGVSFRYQPTNQAGAVWVAGSLGTRYTRTAATLQANVWATVAYYSNPTATPSQRILIDVNGSALPGSNTASYSGAFSAPQHLTMVGATFNNTGQTNSYLVGEMREIIVLAGSASQDSIDKTFAWVNRVK
jgi:hypothetical protein